ncbi:TPA: capsid cement protein, partial [Escherichia coli]
MLPKLKTDDMKTGKKVYLKSGKVQLTNSDSDPLVGVVWADAGTSAEEVPVKLNV